MKRENTNDTGVNRDNCRADVEGLGPTACMGGLASGQEYSGVAVCHVGSRGVGGRGGEVGSGRGCGLPAP